MKSRGRLQRLSLDFAKAADAMRTWAISEEDDLSVSLGFVLR
jgi:hypothetical protein